MASDPSLIEISGEDDSLLQQIPTDDVARSFFSCSPLQIHGSKPRLPPVDSVNKENVNLNKYEMLKLSLEPQQMKRKKKGGGYNLRKSLAWDRAFFTEEGFLDPVELSMISGNSGSSTGEKLPVIHEEGGESLSEIPNSQSVSGDVLALKEKLFEELPVNTTNESRTKHSSSPHRRDALTKRDRALVSSTKRKVLSNYDVNGSRSKRNGSTQSTALSSLIRPVNVNSRKAASKEVNASKKSATKPDSSLRTPTAKIASRVGQPKHSQLAQPGTADKKNAGLKISSSNKTHSEPSTPAGPRSEPPIAKSIVPQVKRNLGKAAFRPTSLTRRNDSTQEMEFRRNPSARDNGARSIKVEAAHPEKARLNGGSIQHVQLKAAKPSGLRMPSPSLGFFGQPKASTKGLLNSYTQPSYDPQSATDSSKSHREVKPLSELKPPYVREKVQKMTIDDTNPNMGLITDISAKSLNLEYQTQDADTESQNTIKMKVKMRQDTLENHQKIHGFLKDGSEGRHRHMELHKIEIKPLADDGNMPDGCDIPFSHMEHCGKEKESNYGKNDTIGSQCVEGPSKVLAGDTTVFSHSSSADSSVRRMQSSFGLLDHQLHCAKGVSEFSRKVKLVESHIYDYDRTSVRNQENQARFTGVGTSEEFQENCEESANNSNDQDDKGNKKERSFVLPLKLAEQADNGFRGLHGSSTETYIEDSESLVCYGSLTASHGGTSLAGNHAAEQVTCENKGAKENDELLVGAKCTMTINNEQPEFHAVEQVAHVKERTIENDDILLIDIRTGCEHQDNVLMIEHSLPSCRHASEVLLNSSTALCPVPPSENVQQTDKAKRVVLHVEENQSAQQESEPIVENSASSSDQQSTDKMYLPGQVDAFNLASSLMVNRDHKTVAAADDTSASLVGLGSDCCSRIKEENRHVSTPLVSVVQDGDDNMLMELKECDDVEVLLNSSTALCTEPPSENVHQTDKAKRIVLYAEENQSAQQESEPMVENSASVGDRQSTDNMNLAGQVDAFNLGSSLMVNRDKKTVAATDDTSASFVGPGSDRCSGIKEEDRYVSTSLVSVVHDGDDNMLMELKESDDVEALLSGSTALCPEPPPENVHKAKSAVLYAEENQSAQQESEMMVENSACFSDRQSTGNMYLPGQVDAFNRGSSLMVNRDQNMVAATDDASASFVGLGSDRCSEIKEEDKYVSTPLVSMVQDGDDNMLMELKECDEVEERQILQSEKNASVGLMTGRSLPNSLTGTELLSREVDNSSHEDSHCGSFGQPQKLKSCYLPNVSVHVEDPSWQDDANQTNEEFHRFDNAMKNSSAVVGQQQLLDGSTFFDCSLKMNGLARDDNFSVASHRNEQSCYQPELHDPCFIEELDSQTHQVLSSNDEISTMDNCFKEPKRCFGSSGSLRQDDISGSECPKADICCQVEPVLQDNSGDIGRIYEDPNVEDVLSISLQKYQSAIYNASLEDNAAVDMNIEEFPKAEVNVMVSYCHSSDEVILDVKNDEAEVSVNNRCIEKASQLKSSILPEKGDSIVPREIFSYDVWRLYPLGSTLNSSKDMTTLVQREICKKDGKQESAIVKPPPDAPPFSEEWLAAFEAAGEEILTMKCGAVQNSPPDKILPEPSPWSPVKRKNNQAIGPYDCTKFTNVCNNSPVSSSE